MMKRILCLLVLVGLGVQAQATVISIVPSSSLTSVGGSVSVDIVISELGSDILTGFDFDLLFDDSILSFESFVFGTDCFGFSCLDVLGFGSFQDVFDFGGGGVNIFELSFDFDEDLDLFQPNDFVLGTFTFTGLQLGESGLEISINELAGAFVFDEFLGFDIASSLSATVENGSVTVPEPGSLILFLSGLFCLGLQRKAKAARA